MVFPLEWIFDTSCSYRICPTRELFTDLKKLDGGSVRLGNVYPYRIRREGTIKVKKFNRAVRIEGCSVYSKL